MFRAWFVWREDNDCDPEGDQFADSVHDSKYGAVPLLGLGNV